MRVDCNKITRGQGGQDVQPQFSMDVPRDVPREQVRELVVSLILEVDHKHFLIHKCVFNN